MLSPRTCEPYIICRINCIDNTAATLSFFDATVDAHLISKSDLQKEKCTLCIAQIFSISEYFLSFITYYSILFISYYYIFFFIVVVAQSLKPAENISLYIVPVTVCT